MTNSENQVEQLASTSGVGQSDSVTIFIQNSKKLFNIDFLKDFIRATPHGLFVDERGLKTVLQTYQNWLDRETAGEVQKSEAKCMKRLFGTNSPQRHYLIEGKVSLNGFLIKSEIKDLQKLGVPYFMGSLTSVGDFIHPNDPQLRNIQNLEVSASFDGAEFKLKSGSNLFIFNDQFLRNFINLSRNSPRILKEFPEMERSLIDSLKAVIQLLKKSRPSSANHVILVPCKFTDKAFNFRTVGSFVFVVGKGDKVISIYELRGKNLFQLVKSELSQIKNQKISGIEIYPEKHRFFGMIRLVKSEYEITSRAFLSFIENISDSPDKRERFTKKFTVKECLERFGAVFQMSQQIEKYKIANHLQDVKVKTRELRINGSWIFVISSEMLIEYCIAKHRKIFNNRR